MEAQTLALYVILLSTSLLLVCDDGERVGTPSELV